MDSLSPIITKLIRADIGKLQTLSANQCGNGVKEGDEQCDCGDPNGEKCKNDPCCDGATCKLKGSAQCR